MAGPPQTHRRPRADAESDRRRAAAVRGVEPARRERRGDAAAALDDSFSIVLLVVAPDHRRTGVGAALLSGLAAQADETVTWLQTGADSDLNALCRARGWQALIPDDDPVVLVAGR